MRKPTIREVGPEYPGEGAIKTIHSWVYLCRMLWEYTKKLKRYRKCVLVTHQKKKKWFQKGILEVKAATNTWRESGDWVALNNNINRGPLINQTGKWSGQRSHILMQNDLGVHKKNKKI